MKRKPQGPARARGVPRGVLLTAWPLAGLDGRLIIALVAGACLMAAPAQASVNSYRFLHVTIDTPWHIFLFLLMGIFAPFILMVVLMWRNSARKRDLARDKARVPARDESSRAAPPPSPQPPQA